MAGYGYLKYLNDARKNHGEDISKQMESTNVSDYFKIPETNSLSKLSDEELNELLKLYN